MEGALLFLDLMIMMLSFSSVIMLSSVVLRTEKGLDKAMKCYLVAGLIILVSSIIQLNKYYSIISLDTSTTLFQISRAMTIYCFCVGSYLMLKVVNKESK